MKLRKCTLHNSKTDWNRFRSLLDALFRPNVRLKSEEDIEIAVEGFNNLVQHAAWESTPLSEEKDAKLKFSHTVREKVAEKRRLKKQWQCSRCPNIKVRLNRAIKDLKRLLDAEKNNGVQKYLQGLDALAASDYSLWKATRKLKQPKIVSPPLRNEDGNWDRSDKEKAETFANHLQRVFLPHPYKGTAEHETEVMRTLAEPHS